MAETSKNKIYYNANENSVADVLADMKKMAESTDKAIENSKYNDVQIKKDISDAKKEQALKDAEQDNKIIELQNEKTELEKELKEAQEDFYQNSIRGQASGEYIHVEDSSNCRSIIGIGGNSEQETRIGKNYLNTLAKYKAGEKVTVDGITYIFNEDGSITCNGTAMADSVLTFSSNLQTINGSGKKIVGMITGTQVPAKLSILAYTSDWSKNTFELLSSVNKNITINMQENIDYTIFRIIAYKGTTLNNQTIYYQILDTSVNDLTYEQYGAMPSPDYISSIVAVGSNANELENTAKTQTIKDVTFTVNEDGTVVANGTASQQVTLVLTKVLSLQKGDYMISGCPRGGTTSTYRIDVWKSDWSSLGFEVGNGTKISLSESIENAIVGITITKGTTVENMVFKPKIEKGKVATPWSPYGQGCVKVIKCNKQLFDKNKALQKYEISGITGNVSANDLYFVTDYIRVNANEQYYLSGKLTGNSNCFYDKNKKFISTVNLENGLLTVPNNPNIYYLRFNSRLTAIDTTMLEKNTKKSAFEQHEEQSYIMPVQQEMLVNDYLDYDNEEEVHMWGKYTFTGEEDYKKSQTYSNDEYLCAYIPTPVINNIKIDGKGLSSHFNRIGDFTTYQNEECVRTSGQLQIRVLVSRLTENSVEGLKVYLKAQYDAGTPVVVYYQLATPTRLKFTDEQKAVAKELNNARTYKNVTNITTDSKAILSLDYAKDLETLLTSKESEV